MISDANRPYPGARPFRRGDADHFFGRAAEARELAELWQDNRLTLAVGPTGSGKTSLLHAGVLPRIRGYESQFTVLPPARISCGSSYPVAALAGQNPYVVSLLSLWSPGEDVTRLAGQTIREFLGKHVTHAGRPILAVIDQGEDLFAEPGARGKHRRNFLSELAEAVRDEPLLHLLLLIREPALKEFSSALGMGTRFGVQLLRFQDAIEAVTGPLPGFTSEGAELLVTDLMTGYATTTDGEEQWVAEPLVQPALLQVACAYLWASLPSSVDLITRREVTGRVDAALAAYCGRVLAAVADEHSQHTARLHAWVLSTFVTELGTSGTAYEGVTDTAGMPNAIARELEDRHLLTSEWRAGTRWYRLLSGRLIEPFRRAAVTGPPPKITPPGNLRHARRAFDLGDLGLAERYAEQVLRRASQGEFRLRAEASSLLGNIAHERGTPADAESHHRTAARLFEAARDTGAAALELAAAGQSLRAQGRLSDAIGDLQSAVARLPHNLVLQAALGQALWQQGQSSAAKAVFTGVLAVDAGNAGALRARGEILADLGEARAALRDLDRILRDEQPGEQPSTLAAHGLAMAELGDHATARKEIEAALADAPRNGPVLLYAARAEALAGDAASAAELAGRALTAADPPLPPHQHPAAQSLSSRRVDHP